MSPWLNQGSTAPLHRSLVNLPVEAEHAVRSVPWGWLWVVLLPCPPKEETLDMLG